MIDYSNLTHDEKQSLYYPAISCVQKAVRRSLYEYARIPASIAWRVNPTRFKMRAFTILYEDNSRDYRLMKYIHQYIDLAWETEEGMLKIISALCRGMKSREACSLCFVSEDNHMNFDPEPMRKHVGNEVLRLRRQFPQRKYADILQDFAKLGYEVPQWMADAFIHLNDGKWEREGLSFFVPYLYGVDKGQAYHTYEFEAPVGSDETYDDLFLLNGIDNHTRAGKMTFNSFCKKGKFDKVLSYMPERFHNRQGLQDMYWYMNSSLMRDYQVLDDGCHYPDFEIGFRQEIITEGVFEAYQELLPELNGFRRWTIDKFTANFVQACNQHDFL